MGYEPLNHMPEQLAEFAAYWAKWKPSTHGAGKRHWFVSKGGDGITPRQDHENSKGDLIRYASYEAAKKVADRLNGVES